MNILHKELKEFVKTTSEELQKTWVSTNEEDNLVQYQELTAKVRQIFKDIQNEEYEKHIPDYMYHKIQIIKAHLQKKIEQTQEIVNQSLINMLLLKDSLENKRNDAHDAIVTIKDKIEMNDEEYTKLNNIDESFNKQLYQLIPVI